MLSTTIEAMIGILRRGRPLMSARAVAAKGFQASSVSSALAFSIAAVFAIRPAHQSRRASRWRQSAASRVRGVIAPIMISRTAALSSNQLCKRS